MWQPGAQSPWRSAGGEVTQNRKDESEGGCRGWTALRMVIAEEARAEVSLL